MCKNLDSPHPLTPSPKDGRGELELSLPSPIFGRGGTRIMSPLSHLWEKGN
jgi:hypothetical protein